MSFKVVTIGVYGFDEAGFFQALRDARVDTFCDLRLRRGVRGSNYAFANSQRLQTRLAQLGIRYLHCRNLAPTQGLRQRQAQADQAKRTTKRQRSVLSEDFIAGYQQERLREFDSRRFAEQLEPAARVVVLFCVEREAAACHRSLVAERLRQDLGIEVIHLMPAKPGL